MPKGEDITTKFQLDITDFKANIQEANRYIKLANSEFKATSSEMDNWSESTEGLNAKIKQLTTVLQAQQVKLAQLELEYEQVVKEQGAASKEAMDLETRINNQKAALNKTQKELSTFTSKLDELQDASNATKTASQQLTDEIGDQENKLASLKERYKDAILTQGKASQEAIELAGEISRLSSELSENKNKLQSAENAADKFDNSLEEVGNEAKETSGGFTIMKGAISDLVSNGIQFAIGKASEFVTSLFSMAEATEEYRRMVAKIEGSANTFGYSVDFAKEQYKEFYSYLADDQMATNAITNLMGMKVSTDTVSNAANAAISVWSAYGDSIPIESLTESINESAQVAKVTGVLADTINWAARSNEDWAAAMEGHSKAQKAFNDAIKEGEAVEDAYTAALEACTDTQERADLIAQTLNQTYGKSKKTYDELSGSMIDANKAEIELKETQAELGKTLEPLNTEFTRLKTKVLKAMSPTIKEVSGEFQDMVDGIDWDKAADSIGDLLETAMGGIKWLANNIDPVTAAVKGMAVAWLTYKTVATSANAVTKVTHALQDIGLAKTVANTTATVAQTTATEGATIATKLLAAAQAATPWGLIAGLIGGVAVGLISLASSTSEANNEQKKISETLKEQKEAWEEVKKAQEDQMASGLSEIDHVKNLKAELDTLVDANGKIKEGYEARAKFITETLAEATGQEISIVDGIIQKYGELSESIDLLIAKKRAQIIVESQEQAYSEALTKKTEALTKMNQFEEEMLEAERLRNEAKKAMDEAYGQEDYLRKMQAWSQLEMDYQNKQSNYKKQAALVKGYNDTIAQYEYDAKLLASRNAEDLAQINNRIKASYDDKGKKVVLSLQEQIANEESELEYWKKQYKKTNDEMYLDQVNAAESRLTELKKELEAQRSTVDSNTPQITSAWSRLSQLTFSTFNEKTPSFLKAALEQTDNVKKGVQKGTPDAEGAYKSLAKKGVDAVEGKYQDYYDAGSYVTGGIQSGVNDSSSPVYTTMSSLAWNMIDTFKKNLKIQSPSKIFTDLSKFIPEGVKKGVLKNTNVAVKAVRTMTDKVAKEGKSLKAAIPLEEMQASLSSSLSDLKPRLRTGIVQASQQAQQVRDIAFNQTIVSPKPLTRREIYQETHNLLFSAKARLKNV